jgi:hypothetical protein
MSQTAITTTARQRPAVAGGRRNSLWLPLALAGVIVAGAYFGSPNFRFAAVRTAGPYAGDFLQEWLGGYIVLRGDYARFYDPDYAHALQHDARLVGFAFPADRYLPIVYPPFYYVLTSPLCLLSVRVAAWVWAALMLGCLAASAVCLGRYAVARRESAPRGSTAANRAPPARGRAVGNRLAALLPWALPAALLYQPLLESLTSNQKGTVCLLLLTATFLLLDRRRSFAAGLVFGLLAFKPQLALVIGLAMLLKREWWFVAGGAVTGTLLVAISFALSPDVCRQYYQFATGTADYLGTNGYPLEKSHCLYGFFSLLFGAPGLPARLAALVAGLGVVALLVRLLWPPTEPGSPRWAAQFSGLVVATVLLSPHLITYDLTILLLPMFLLLVNFCGEDLGKSRLHHSLVALLALVFVLPAVSVNTASVTHLQLTVPVLVALQIVLCLAVSKSPAMAPSTPAHLQPA